MRDLRLMVSLLLLGTLLVLLSSSIGSMFGGFSWSDDDALRLQQASLDFHDATHSHSEDQHDGSSDQAERAYVDQRRAFERSQEMGASAEVTAWYLGLGAIGAGLGIYMLRKSQ
jgi:hypothetical protein